MQRKGRLFIPYNYLDILMNTCLLRMGWVTFQLAHLCSHSPLPHYIELFWMTLGVYKIFLFLPFPCPFPGGHLGSGESWYPHGIGGLVTPPASTLNWDLGVRQLVSLSEEVWSSWKMRLSFSVGIPFPLKSTAASSCWYAPPQAFLALWHLVTIAI